MLNVHRERKSNTAALLAARFLPVCMWNPPLALSFPSILNSGITRAG